MQVYLAVAAFLVAAAYPGRADQVIYDFDTTPGAEVQVHVWGAAAATVPSPGGTGQALQLTCADAQWPNVTVRPADVWDFSDYGGVAVDVTNPGGKAARVFLRVDNEGARPSQKINCNEVMKWLQPGETGVLALRFKTEGAGPLWGMRGYPSLGDYPLTTPAGTVLDLERVAGIAVALWGPLPDQRLIVDNLRLWGEAGSPEAAVPAFVDRFGQYALQNWPGRVHEEQDLVQHREAERAALGSPLPLPGRDEYGGWADGPKLTATGWFRTEKLDGKWWLVSPKGTLFFSNGVDCVSPFGGSTIITKREPYFQWLPERDGPFGDFFGFRRSFHSHAEPVADTGADTFDFYRANLLRKYGEDWRGPWTDMTFARMRAWGFNTIANWSDRDVLQQSPVPFTATVWVPGDHRRVEGGTGYWGKMHDPYDLDFARDVERGVALSAEQFADNPLCIGYFVDNELAWGGDEGFDIAVGALACRPDQPCRQEFVRMLREEYGTLDAVNAAWGTGAADWDALRVPQQRPEQCKGDLNAFIRELSLRYFNTVAAAVRKHAPNQLYLGCRFAWRNMVSVRACAEAADVVSFNIYRPRVDPEQWTFASELGKPCIIGEFHFGATDRGMLHPGLVRADDQAGRGQMYRDYVNSVADHPAFVGCHWFKYVDEALTGRPLDGENYSIGLISVTDTPYAEMVEAARQVHGQIYERRYGQ